MKFKHPDHEVSFYVWVSLFVEGATCERVKIGEEEETTMQPIYEIVCKDGAGENESDQGEQK